ncbi:MAG: DUF4390 domain-containing protein [Gallionellaceae bacterium]|jgi:hypothetical protein|nr:DUF4390 domain-containing protein [Gallionellaceae bacterium]
MMTGSGKISALHARRLLAAFFLLLSLFSLAPAASAAGIETRKVEAHLVGNTYQFTTDFDIRLNFVVEQALEQGVPLYFISEFSLTRPRWYWFDETVVQSTQIIRLSYNTLTRQYRITRGALFQNFNTLDEAVRIIAHQPSALVPAGLLTDDSYVATVRLRLDTSQLPKPLQVNALAGNDWNLDSDRYRWIVHPAEITRD